MRVLVCGGRDFENKKLLYDTLDQLKKDEGIEVIITGMASGADNLSWLWAHHRDVNQLEFPADWKRHGRAAGAIRNQRMLDEGKPDLVIAFPTSKSVGTWDMVRRAKAANVETRIVI